MIKTFLCVLALVSQISAFKYNQETNSYATSEQSAPSNNVKYSYSTASSKDYQKISATSGQKSSQTIRIVAPTIPTTPITRNLVVRGKYPVALQNSGPAIEKKISVVTSHIKVPVQEKPVVRLSSKIPAPKTVAHTCTCYKTIMKPRVQQHIITVPSIHRYIETTHRPVVENIHYEAYPIKYLDSEGEKEKTQVQTYQVKPSESSKEKSEVETFEISNTRNQEPPKSEKLQVIELPRFQFSNQDESKTQNFQISRFQFTEKPQKIEIPIRFLEQEPQEIKIPRTQYVEAKKSKTVEISELPRVRFVESQKPETIEIPQARMTEPKRPQIIEIPNTQFLENKSKAIEVPRLEFVQAQKLQAVEIPRSRAEESPKVRTVEIPHEGGTITLGTSPFMYQF